MGGPPRARSHLLCALPGVGRGPSLERARDLAAAHIDRGSGAAHIEWGRFCAAAAAALGLLAPDRPRPSVFVGVREIDGPVVCRKENNKLGNHGALPARTDGISAHRVAQDYCWGRRVAPISMATAIPAMAVTDSLSRLFSISFSTFTPANTRK